MPKFHRCLQSSVSLFSQLHIHLYLILSQKINLLSIFQEVLLLHEHFKNACQTIISFHVMENVPFTLTK